MWALRLNRVSNSHFKYDCFARMLMNKIGTLTQQKKLKVAMEKDEEEIKEEERIGGEKGLQATIKDVSLSESSMPTQMEKKHVYEVYDKIAPHFSHTRYKPWPKIEKFLLELADGSLVYDVGCGNGKYMGVNKSLFMVGTDRSIGLLKSANEKSQDYQLFAADSLYLPVRSESCDAFISIAVIHHFSNTAIRHRAINELTRITRVGGVGLIYVWAFQQEMEGHESVSKKKFLEQDVFVPWHLNFKFEGDLQKIDHTGCEIDYAKRSVIYKRYYHVFKQGELQDLLRDHKEIEILESYYDKQNWCCKVRRIM